MSENNQLAVTGPKASAKHKRGDFDPATGLYYWAKIHLRNGTKWDYWVPIDVFNRHKTGMHRRVVEWQKRNPDKVKHNSLRQRKRQKDNGTRNRASDNTPKSKARAAAYKSEWEKMKMKTDPLFRLKVLVRKRIRNALAAAGVKKCARSFDIVGCSPKFLRAYLESLFLSGMSWERRSEIHIDHRIPLASASTEAELLGLCHYTNLQPLWKKDNLSKGSKIAA